MYRRNWEDYYGDNEQPISWRSMDLLGEILERRPRLPGLPESSVKAKIMI